MPHHVILDIMDLTMTRFPLPITPVSMLEMVSVGVLLLHPLGVMTLVPIPLPQVAGSFVQASDPSQKSGNNFWQVFLLLFCNSGINGVKTVLQNRNQRTVFTGVGWDVKWLGENPVNQFLLWKLRNTHFEKLWRKLTTSAPPDIDPWRKIANRISPAGFM